MRAVAIAFAALAAAAAAAEEPQGNLPRMRGWIPDHLMEFIQNTHKRSEIERRDLEAAQAEEKGEPEKRQAVAPGGGLAPGAVTQPTQMPTVTVFQLSGKAIPYTQTFPPTPGLWPGPTNGVIGL